MSSAQLVILYFIYNSMHCGLFSVICNTLQWINVVPIVSHVVVGFFFIAWTFVFKICNHIALRSMLSMVYLHNLQMRMAFTNPNTGNRILNRCNLQIGQLELDLWNSFYSKSKQARIRLFIIKLHNKHEKLPEFHYGMASCRLYSCCSCDFVCSICVHVTA